jgi:tagatose 6-phosphate kinase
MIVAAGLTPAWQHILLFDSLARGEVNRAREVWWCASGKVVNVGVAVHRLGGRCITLAPLGGSTGARIEEEYAREGMEGRWVRVQSPTRVCTTILEAEPTAITELVENGPPIDAALLEAYAGAFEEIARTADTVVLSGSLSRGAPTRFFRDLMDRSDARFILDIRGPELLECLGAHPYLVKPNRDELARTLGRCIASDGDMRAAMEELHRLGARNVVVSQGRSGLSLSGPEGFRFLRPPVVATVNPIGCGDCLAAGIAWATDRGLPVDEAVRIGTAAAASRATMVLPSRLVLEDVLELAQEVQG